jgi:hypothetical protein
MKTTVGRGVGLTLGATVGMAVAVVFTATGVGGLCAAADAGVEEADVGGG